MKIPHILLLTVISLSVSMPAHAASWGQIEKGACEGTTGKRIYTAKLKRNFGDDPAANLCPRLHKTIAGKSRVPDKCEKKGLAGYSGTWLVDDATCTKKTAEKNFATPIRRGNT